MNPTFPPPLDAAADRRLGRTTVLSRCLIDNLELERAVAPPQDDLGRGAAGVLEPVGPPLDPLRPGRLVARAVPAVERPKRGKPDAGKADRLDMRRDAVAQREIVPIADILNQQDVAGFEIAAGLTAPSGCARRAASRSG